MPSNAQAEPTRFFRPLAIGLAIATAMALSTSRAGAQTAAKCPCFKKQQIIKICQNREKELTSTGKSKYMAALEVKPRLSKFECGGNIFQISLVRLVEPAIYSCEAYARSKGKYFLRLIRSDLSPAQHQQCLSILRSVQNKLR